MAVAIPVALVALAAASTAVGVAGAISNGQAQKKSSDYNAAVAANNATAARQQADYDVAQKQRNLQRALGSQSAAYAKAGVDPSGSVEDVSYDSILSGETDILATRYKGQIAANNQTAQGQLYSMQGQNAQNASYLSAGSTLLSGAMSGYKAYMNV